MLRIFLFSIAVFYSTISVFGQSNDFILPAGRLLKEVSWRDSIYLFAKFLPGEIIFIDTKVSPPQRFPLNLNLFTERMDALAETGDTLTLTNFSGQHMIKAGNNLFYFFPGIGYLEILEAGPVYLARLNYFRSGYLVSKSTPVSHAVSESVLLVDNRAEAAAMDRFYSRQNLLYLIKDHKAYPVVRRTLVNSYPENKGVARLYLQNHKVNYKNEEELGQAVRYLNELGTEPERKVSGMYRVRAGDDIKKYYKDSVYFFPKFEKARIEYILADEYDQTGFMNYNLYSGRIDYLNEMSDTLELNKNFQSIVYFGNRILYSHPLGGFAEVLQQGPQALCELNVIKLIQENLNPDSPVVYAKPLTFEDKTLDRLYIRRTSYWFLDRNYFWSMADKFAFLNYFPTKKKQINSYLRSHPVKFDNKADLLRLLAYCRQL